MWRPHSASSCCARLSRPIPKELDDAARVEGAGTLQTLWRSMCRWRVRSTSPTALVSVSYHWNNFLWPLIVTNSVEARPLTVGLQVFSSVDQGIDWSIICAATLMTSAPLMIAFLLFQRAVRAELPARRHPLDLRRDRPVLQPIGNSLAASGRA